MYPLYPHASTPSAAISGLRASLARQPGGGLQLCYELRAELAMLRLPKPAPAVQTDLLWQHTCFECFLGSAQTMQYYEYNFSPSGAWAAYAFADYRQPQPWVAPPVPHLTWHRTTSGLQLAVQLPASPPGLAVLPWVCGLSAVLEAADGTLSYWALAHPAGRPDFHQREGWLHVIGP